MIVGRSQLHLTGSVQVFCGHGRQKRQVKDFLFDARKLKPHLCPCCENLYGKSNDVPGMCETCSTSIGVRSNALPV